MRKQWFIDDDRLQLKHDNLATRSIRLGDMPGVDRVVMNFRPLGEWMMSNWKWARKHGYQVPIERYQEGEFFSVRTGSWRPADWWLQYFEMDRVTDFMRLDHLGEDLNAFLQSVHPDLPLMSPGHLNQLGASPSADISEAARQANPLWTALESRLWP